MNNQEQDMKKIADKNKKGWSFIDNGKGTKVIKKGESK